MSAHTQPPSLDADVPSLDYKNLSIDDKLNIPGLEHVVWTKATTKNGQSYAVGVGKASTDIKSELQAGLSEFGGPVLKPAHGEPEAFSIGVNWPVADAFVATSTEVYDVAGISKYELKKNAWWNYYDYCLWIDNNVNYTYSFQDETGDVYKLTTLIHGEHYVQYDSKKPTIIKVSGSVLGL